MKIICRSILQILISTFILMIVSICFSNYIYLDMSYYGIWPLLVAIIIFILNKTIKPYIFKLTIPLTALTYGLFYPLINVFIFYLVSILLGNHFQIMNIWFCIIIVIIISILQHLFNTLIIEPIMKER